MLSETYTGSMFALMVMNAPYLGISFYNLEHVRNPGFNLQSTFYYHCFDFFQSGAGMSLEGAGRIGFPIVVLVSGLLWPFFLCHFGSFTTERIRSIDETVYNANWFDYPADVRKYIILVMVRTRSNINFSGFNMISCNLEVFGKVLNIL